MTIMNQGLDNPILLNHISDEYFYRMLSPISITYSKPYNLEERDVLEDTLKYNEYYNYDLVIVGAGCLRYAELGLMYNRNYIAIEPLMHIYVNNDINYICSLNKRIRLINKDFEEIQSTDLISQKIVCFMFNIISYIHDPIDHINDMLMPGDIIMISTWAKTQEARVVRDQYISYLNSYEDEQMIDPVCNSGICDLDMFPVTSINNYKSHKRVINLHCDVLFIYTA